jgi:glycosyltransferase involved in cell wall biosynthesis
MSKPLNVLFFSPSLGVGGAEMQVLRLLQRLDRASIRPSLSVARGGGSYESRLPADISVHVCTHGINSSLLSVASSIVALRQRIERERPDVVMALLEHASVVLVSALALLAHPPKLVLGIQNNFSQTLATVPRSLAWLLPRLYRRAYERADHVIAISRGVARDLSQHLPSTAPKTSVVYNAGMDEELEQLARAPLAEARSARPLLVACGRLSEQKDYVTLIRALPLLATQPAPELWVLGEGALKESLQRLAGELGVLERIRWLGFQKNPFPFMAAADAFVLSSRWEGFANVVVEALACGTPVVATNCPYGPEEILDGGRYGKLVQVGEPAALARAIDEQLARGKSPALSAELRQRARSFDALSSAAGYTSALLRVAAAAAGSSPSAPQPGLHAGPS